MDRAQAAKIIRGRIAKWEATGEELPSTLLHALVILAEPDDGTPGEGYDEPIVLGEPDTINPVRGFAIDTEYNCAPKPKPDESNKVFAGPLTGEEYKISPPLDDSLMSTDEPKAPPPAEVIAALRAVRDWRALHWPPSVKTLAAAVRELSWAVMGIPEYMGGDDRRLIDVSAIARAVEEMDRE